MRCLPSVHRRKGFGRTLPSFIVESGSVHSPSNRFPLFQRLLLFPIGYEYDCICFCERPFPTRSNVEKAGQESRCVSVQSYPICLFYLSRFLHLSSAGVSDLFALCMYVHLVLLFFSSPGDRETDRRSLQRALRLYLLRAAHSSEAHFVSTSNRALRLSSH